MKKNNTNLLTKLAFLVALSAVAAYLPLPSPTGTVALDSAPGYFAVLVFGGGNGALVLGLGHIFSSLRSGFPLGALHLLIAVLMGFCGIVFNWVYSRTNLLAASIVAVLLNGIGISAALIPILGLGFFTAMTLPLFTGSLINVLAAVILYNLLKDRMDGIGIEKRT